MSKIYTVINDCDGNDTFTVEANNPEDAASAALATLGWWIAAPDTEEEN